MEGYLFLSLLGVFLVAYALVRINLRGSPPSFKDSSSLRKEEDLWAWQSGGPFNANKYRLTNLAFYASEGRRVDTIPLSRIRSVRVERGFIEGIRGKGTLILITAAQIDGKYTEEDTFEVEGVPDPDRTAALFTRAIADAQRYR